MICRELGFASPRHLFSVLTPQERNEWIAFFNIEAERMNPDAKKDDMPPEAAFNAWKALARAQQERG